MSTGHLYKLCSQRPFLLLHVRCTRDNVKLQTANPKRIQKNIKEWNEFGIKPCCICLLCFLPEPRRRQSWTLHDCDHSCVSSSGIPRPSYASVQWIKGMKGLIQTSCPDTNPTNSKRLQTSNYKYNNVFLCCCLIFLHRFREITRPTLSGNVQSSASSWGGRNPESPCTVWKHHKSHHFRTPHDFRVLLNLSTSWMRTSWMPRPVYLFHPTPRTHRTPCSPCWLSWCSWYEHLWTSPAMNWSPSHSLVA